MLKPEAVFLDPNPPFFPRVGHVVQPLHQASGVTSTINTHTRQEKPS